MRLMKFLAAALVSVSAVSATLYEDIPHVHFYDCYKTGRKFDSQQTKNKAREFAANACFGTFYQRVHYWNSMHSVCYNLTTVAKLDLVVRYMGPTFGILDRNDCFKKMQRLLNCKRGQGGKYTDEMWYMKLDPNDGQCGPEAEKHT